MNLLRCRNIVHQNNKYVIFTVDIIAYNMLVEVEKMYQNAQENGRTTHN